MSSSSHSTGEVPTQRVPAWKRLGLKLKPASETQSHGTAHNSTNPVATAAPPATSSVPNNRAHLGGSTPNAKRRASGSAPALDHSVKRARQDIWQDKQQISSHPTPKKAKSVTFTADTAESQPSAPVKTKQQKRAAATTTTTNTKATVVPTKPVKKSAPVNLEPALAYLRTWHTARESWKFNKNHQTKLLEQVFAGADETTIPAADIGVFYQYIRGLQGGVRTRLRELASGVRAEDMESGAAGFAGGGKTADMAAQRQREYEAVIRTFLNQARASASPEKRRFDEVEYVLRTTDMEMQRRVVKRMRAETVLDELSDTDSSETTTTTASTGTSTTSGESNAHSRNLLSGPAADSSNNDNDDDDGNNDAKRLRLNDGPQQRTKRKRKLRTALVEDDTSSESESESGSGADTSSSGSSSSSSSGSDSDSDSDDDEAPSGARVSRIGAHQDMSSSSSSSSSSSEAESDSDDED